MNDCAPTPGGNHGPGLATRTMLGKVPMTVSSHSMNPHGARLGVSIHTQGDEAMSMHEYFDRPPAGWFALDVMRKEARKWDWVVLTIDLEDMIATRH
jgi:hypothetical protein